MGFFAFVFVFIYLQVSLRMGQHDATNIGGKAVRHSSSLFICFIVQFSVAMNAEVLNTEPLLLGEIEG